MTPHADPLERLICAGNHYLHAEFYNKGESCAVHDTCTLQVLRCLMHDEWSIASLEALSAIVYTLLGPKYYVMKKPQRPVVVHQASRSTQLTLLPKCTHAKKQAIIFYFNRVHWQQGGRALRTQCNMTCRWSTSA